MKKPVEILVVGCGRMGSAHAAAYQQTPGVQISGLVSSYGQSASRLSDKLGGYPVFDDYFKALRETQPEAVSINTYADTHSEFAMEALRRGISVFVEKPMGITKKQIEAVRQLAQSAKAAVMPGLILRVHPAYQKFVSMARQFIGPVRLTFSFFEGVPESRTSQIKKVFASVSPLLEVGIHYIDLMFQIIQQDPIDILGQSSECKSGSGLPHTYNRASLRFPDGSQGVFFCGFKPDVEHRIKKICTAVSGSHILDLRQAGNGAFSVVHQLSAPDGSISEVERHVFQVTKSQLCRIQAARFLGLIESAPSGYIDALSIRSHLAALEAERLGLLH